MYRFILDDFFALEKEKQRMLTVFVQKLSAEGHNADRILRVLRFHDTGRNLKRSFTAHMKWGRDSRYRS